MTLHKQHGVIGLHKDQIGSTAHVFPNHGGIRSLVHKARRSTLTRAGRMSQQASASRSGDNQCWPFGPIHRKAAKAAFQPSRDPSRELPDRWSAEQSCNSSEIAHGSCTVTEDRMLEKAIHEWDQLCQEMHRPELLEGLSL